MSFMSFWQSRIIRRTDVLLSLSMTCLKSENERVSYWTKHHKKVILNYKRRGQEITEYEL